MKNKISFKGKWANWAMGLGIVIILIIIAYFFYPRFSSKFTEIDLSKPLTVVQIRNYVDDETKKAGEGCMCSTKKDGSTCSWVNRKITFEGYATEMGPDFYLTDTSYLYKDNQMVGPILGAQHYGKFKVDKTTKVRLTGKLGFSCAYIMGGTSMTPKFQVEEMEVLN
jgi:hypothetical protein